MQISTLSFARPLRYSIILALVAMSLALPFAAFADGDAALAGATITIPALNVSTSVVNIPLDPAIGTWNTNSLGGNIGHFEYTPWLGESGNIVLGGHSTDDAGAPSIFYHLEDITVGDAVTISNGSVVQEYVVTGTRFVAISDVSVLYPTGRDIVTLITCAGYNGETGVYDQRLVVTARRVN
ncbi:MAG: class F sortase [Anaerolineae bacterium]|nr:class F sortase [Anaerolineae bacterium]MCA9907724.1 class F sortase [Anaerolineae bacterium]